MSIKGQAFIAGATEAGADVVDYGMLPTDALYYAVARDGHEGGVQIVGTGATSPAVTAFAWAAVGIPLAIGIWITLQKAVVLFQ